MSSKPTKKRDSEGNPPTTKYEFIEHTADIGVKAHGRTLSECFANAATAMFDIITDGSAIASIGMYEITLDADDIEQLLVDWLSELLYLHDARGYVFGRFEVRLDEAKRALTANVYGEQFDPGKHAGGKEIKAATYHMLEVNEDAGWVQVLFDI